MSSQPIEHLNRSSVSAWNENAQYWDDHIGSEGNDVYRVLELPALEKLVKLTPGEHALDLATGNGIVSRWLASIGGIVVGTDASEAMLEIAKRRIPEGLSTKISYLLLDVTKEAQLEELILRCEKHTRFDVITMNMAIMDVPTLDPLAAALPRLLKLHGRFVATVLHPAFCSAGAARNVEWAENPATGRGDITHAITIKRYLSIPPAKGLTFSASNQPALQMCFHRSISELFDPFFKAGLVLDGLEEPAFPALEQSTGRIESWANYPQIPLILAFRFQRSVGSGSSDNAG